LADRGGDLVILATMTDEDIGHVRSVPPSEYRKIKRPFPPTVCVHPVAYPAPPAALPAVLPSAPPARPPGTPPAARPPLRAPQAPGRAEIANSILPFFETRRSLDMASAIPTASIEG